MQSSLTSLPHGFHAAVFGAGGGVGAALPRALAADPRCARLHAFTRKADPPEHAKIAPGWFDLEDEASIKAAADSAFAAGPVRLIIVATGLLHAPGLAPEKSWRHLDAAAMGHAFAVNAIGPALIARHTLGQLPRTEKAVFAALSARVGSVSDNRLGGWHAYRASKAALNQILRTCAIELARSHPEAACLGLHPGTVDTPLSRPFQGNVPPEKLFSAEDSAGRLLAVIDALGSAESGKLFDWAGEEIAP